MTIVRRYQLVIETDEYALLSAINALAEAALGRDSEVTWIVRSDEELRSGRLLHVNEAQR